MLELVQIAEHGECLFCQSLDADMYRLGATHVRLCPECGGNLSELLADAQQEAETGGE